MSAPKGNRFWEARSSHGRDRIFQTPEILWEACVEYFEWVEANPLEGAKVTHFQGKPVKLKEPKLRAMTLNGLWLFLGVNRKTWDLYREREDFIPVIDTVEAAIYEQKFTGAAADLLNANIISRELGLADKQEHTGKDGKPMEVANTFDVARRLAYLLGKAAE